MAALLETGVDSLGDGGDGNEVELGVGGSFDEFGHELVHGLAGRSWIGDVDQEEGETEDGRGRAVDGCVGNDRVVTRAACIRECGKNLVEFLNSVPVGPLLCLGDAGLELGEVAWDVWVCADSDAGNDAECASAAAAESPKKISVLDVICDDMLTLYNVSRPYFGFVSVDVPWR